MAIRLCCSAAVAARIALSLLLGALPVSAQNTAASEAPSASQSWTATSGQQGLSGNANPTRSSQTHAESAGRTFDTQSIEILGPDGRYVPYLDIEKESLQVDASTVRAIERTFARDADGRKILRQVSEVEQRNLGDGQQKVARTTSNPDANGQLQVVSREIQESKSISANVRETRTTVLMPDINSGLAPAMLIQERDTKGTGQSEFRKSTLLPDGNGGWQLSEVREGVIRQDGKDSTREEHVLRPNVDGKLAEAERTVSKETQAAEGEQHATTETYSTDIPGSAEDGHLHLNQRTTKVRRAQPDGRQMSEQRLEQRDPGAPGDTPHLTQRTIDIVRPGVGGATQERSTQSLDANGAVVWVDTQKTSSAPTVQVEIAPPAKPR